MERSVRWQVWFSSEGHGSLKNTGIGEAQDVKLTVLGGIGRNLPEPPNPWPAGHVEEFTLLGTLQTKRALRISWTEESGRRYEQEVR